MQTLENDQEEGNVKKLQEHIRLMSDERKCVIALILVLLMGLLLVYTYAGDGCRNDHEGILRLHVIANSNKVGDQALKLKVRDAVIEYMADQKDLKTVDETREYLKENKKRLQRIAEGVIAAQVYDYPAAVELGVRYIPQKTYGDITFPAGNYEALNITIGSGQGENWWCVLFPPLCFVDVTSGIVPDDSKELLKENLSQEEYDLICNGNSEDLNNSDITFKFKIVELLNNTKMMLASKN